jgi:small subunit ribosomal protein S2
VARELALAGVVAAIGGFSLANNPRPPYFASPFTHRHSTNGRPEGSLAVGFPSIARPESRRDNPRIMINELISDMVDAGVHYGHQTKKWNPKMKPYLMKDKGGIYIINLEQTVKCLDKAADFLSDIAGKNKKILFVGCKRQAQDAIREAAEATGQFYVNHRWLGGMLTNMTTVRKSIERLKWLENIEKQPEFKAMSKKELSALGRERDKLLRNLRGIRGMEGKPDAIVIVDSARESIAVAEARRLEIPIVAIVDTNADPAVVNYPIPGNDDAVRAIRIILQNLVDAIVAGKKG